MCEIVFDVELDEDGNYCASAEAGTRALFTDGKDLNELHAMILDILRLFELETDVRVTSYSLRFAESRPAAA